MMSRCKKMDSLIDWCQNNNPLNVNKTKALIVDFRKGKPRIYEPVLGWQLVLERLNNFLGMLSSDDLFWGQHFDTTIKKAGHTSTSVQD